MTKLEGGKTRDFLIELGYSRERERRGEERDETKKFEKGGERISCKTRIQFFFSLE